MTQTMNYLTRQVCGMCLCLLDLPKTESRQDLVVKAAKTEGMDREAHDPSLLLMP
jgi:hypothetical protein